MSHDVLAPRTRTLAPGDTFIHTRPDDALSLPVLRDLEREYDARYGNLFGEPASAEINRYPVSTFSAPEGTFLLLVREGTAIAAGAFMRVDDEVIEFKRMWTHADHRGHGLALLVLDELEAEASRRGARKVVLSTGPRQPEAVALYRKAGYTPLFDQSLPPEIVIIHHFEKELTS